MPGIEPRTPGLCSQCSATELRQPDNICTAQAGLIMGAGGCPVAVAQWQSTGCTSQVSWVRFPVTAGLFTFLYFCFKTSTFYLQASNGQLLPSTEANLCKFVVYLANQKLKHQMIRVYLSGLQHLQIIERLGDPFLPGAFSCLEHVLKGIKHTPSAQSKTPASLSSLRFLGSCGLCGVPMFNIQMWLRCGQHVA